jgi:hypothetical protein
MARDKSSNDGGAFLALAVAVAAAGIALPFIGAKNMVRGYERSVPKTVFLTIGWNSILILTGTVLQVISIPIIYQFFHAQQHADGQQPAANTGIVILTVTLSILAGLLIGAIQRPGRFEAFAIARDNIDFLIKNNLTPGDDDAVTYYDAQNNPLRFLEKRDDREVYMAVGRRNKRAYIDLDTSGRMVRYSGIVSL